MANTASITQKATVVPIAYGSWDFQITSPLPILPSQNVFIEDVQGLLSPSDFDLWEKYLPAKEREDLSSFRLALVQRFTSLEHVGKEEQKSKDLLHQVFVCLRVIRPTRAQFQAIQFKILDERKVDVFSISNAREIPSNIPQSDALNSIRSTDIATMRGLIEDFLELVHDGPLHVRRGVRYYNSGYSDTFDPIVQIVLWTAGIEAIVSSGGVLRREELLGKLYSSIGANWNIYEDSAVGELTRAHIKISEVAGDLFDLRSRLVHGAWFPDEWAERQGRSGVSGTVAYVDVLREAASAILRKLLMNWLISQKVSG